MDYDPRDNGEACQFDAYCKLILYHEALDYLREQQRQRKHEISLTELSPVQEEQLYSTDSYPSDRFVFASHGCELQIDDETVAGAFAQLPKPAQSILILRCVLELSDREIGPLVGMSRSAVQRRRIKALEELQVSLSGLMPEEGARR